MSEFCLQYVLYAGDTIYISLSLAYISCSRLNMTSVVNFSIDANSNKLMCYGCHPIDILRDSASAISSLSIRRISIGATPALCCDGFNDFLCRMQSTRVLYLHTWASLCICSSDTKKSMRSKYRTMGKSKASPRECCYIQRLAERKGRDLGPLKCRLRR